MHGWVLKETSRLQMRFTGSMTLHYRVIFFAWANGEPNDPREECVQIYAASYNAGRWNDKKCSMPVSEQKIAPVVLCQKRLMRWRDDLLCSLYTHNRPIISLASSSCTGKKVPNIKRPSPERCKQHIFDVKIAFCSYSFSERIITVILKMDTLFSGTLTCTRKGDIN